MPAAAGQAVSRVVRRCHEAGENGGHLDLSSCDLARIPDAVYFLLRGTRVTSVSLHGNELAKVPVKLPAKMPHLVALDLSQNNIVAPPASMSPYEHLERLDLSWNAIAGRLPDALCCHMAGLVALDVSHNQITDLPGGTLPPSLRTVYVGGNPLSDDAKAAIAEQGPSKVYQLQGNLSEHR